MIILSVTLYICVCWNCSLPKIGMNAKFCSKLCTRIEKDFSILFREKNGKNNGKYNFTFTFQKFRDEKSILCLLGIDYKNYFKLLLWLIDKKPTKELLEIIWNICHLQKGLCVGVYWYNGTLVQWYTGIMAHWYNGTLG